MPASPGDEDIIEVLIDLLAGICASSFSRSKLFSFTIHLLGDDNDYSLSQSYSVSLEFTISAR